MTEALQLSSKVAEVVDLTVEGQDVPLTARSHGLVALSGQVDDRETSVCNRNTNFCTYPLTRVIGSSMRQRCAHQGHLPLKRGRRRAAAEVPDSRYPTHVSVGPLRDPGPDKQRRQGRPAPRPQSSGLLTF